MEKMPELPLTGKRICGRRDNSRTTCKSSMDGKVNNSGSKTATSGAKWGFEDLQQNDLRDFEGRQGWYSESENSTGGVGWMLE